MVLSRQNHNLKIAVSEWGEIRLYQKIQKDFSTIWKV